MVLGKKYGNTGVHSPKDVFSRNFMLCSLVALAEVLIKMGIDGTVIRPCNIVVDAQCLHCK